MDQQAEEIRKLVEPIEQKLMRTAWSILGNVHDAEDALQETMAIVLRRWNRVQAHPCAPALLIKICTECSLDLMRKRKRRLAHSSSQFLDSICKSGDAPEAAMVNSEIRQEVVTAIAALPRQQATAFMLRVVDEYDYEQIATLMNCSPCTVRTHVARARHKLSKLVSSLNPDGGPRDE